MNHQEPIKRMPEKFTKNGTRYQLKKRTKTVAMYQQLANFSGTVLALEVFKVKVMPPNNFVGTSYEKFPSNEDIGKAMGAKSFGGKAKLEQAEAYFTKLERECQERAFKSLSTSKPFEPEKA